MPTDQGDDQVIYRVVVNDEEQYSIWPVTKANAAGWRDAGKSGTRAECLAFISNAWKDMRPLSVRKQVQDTQA